MEHIRLSNSDLEVSRICFGGEQLGGFGWGSYDIKNTIDAANQGIERGLNFFDTADCYGLGESEINLGKLIKGRRDKCIIGTKFGVNINKNATKNRVSYNNNSSYIEKALHDSLNRLNTDYIDLYQVHYWDKKTPLESVFSTLEKYCESGKIRYYGISNFDCLDIKKEDFPHLLSFSYEYSLANREKEEIIANHIKKGLSFLTFGALGQGILTGKYNKQTSFDFTDRRHKEAYVNFFGEKLEHNLRIVEVMRQISQNYQGVSVAQIALRWIIEKLPSAVLVTGIKKMSQLDDNLNIFNFELTEDEMSKLDRVSLDYINI